MTTRTYEAMSMVPSEIIASVATQIGVEVQPDSYPEQGEAFLFPHPEFDGTTYFFHARPGLGLPTLSDIDRETRGEVPRRDAIDQRASSLIVAKGIWVFCSEKNFQGERLVRRGGALKTLAPDWGDRILSLFCLRV